MFIITEIKGIKDGFLKLSRFLKQKEKYYFRLSRTCQIPKLSIIYEQYFGKKDDGCFIEVGAYDGEYVSNTSGLADKGWSGYYLEPVPEYYKKCLERHKKNKNVIVKQIAIGEAPRNIKVNIGGPLSTICDDQKSCFNSLSWSKGKFLDKKINAHQTTLDIFLEKEKVKEAFELLVVDVEGYEWNVFRGFNIKKWKPQMVIVELHDQNDDYIYIRDNCNKIVDYFYKNNYKVIYKDFTNTIYVPRDSFPSFVINYNKI